MCCVFRLLNHFLLCYQALPALVLLFLAYTNDTTKQSNHARARGARQIDGRAWVVDCREREPSPEKTHAHRASARRVEASEVRKNATGKSARLPAQEMCLFRSRARETEKSPGWCIGRTPVQPPSISLSLIFEGMYAWVGGSVPTMRVVRPLA